jgi:outer membrane protein OmpA-like peptidoglycan-associated protein
MLNNPKLKVAIVVHAEKANDKANELAKKRADVVKWYLVEQGVAAAQLVAAGGPPVAKKKPLLVVSIAQ